MALPVNNSLYVYMHCLHAFFTFIVCMLVWNQGIRDSSQPVNSDIHLFLSEAKDKERVSIDVGNGRTCQYSGVKVLGLFWLTPISILQKNHDTPLLLTIITDDGFGLIQVISIFDFTFFESC